MDLILSYLIWSPDPDMFVIPIANHPVRWYGLLFALGFIISQQIMFYIYKTEGRPEKDVEKLTVYMVVATILGARLGHCLFYNPGYYLTNPIEILKIWEGGLASHGGAIGIILAIYFFAKKYPQYPMLWTLDRLAIVVALTGALIRTGNFFNSEMEGKMTHADYGVVYARFTEDFLYNNLGRKVENISFEKGGDKASNMPGFYPITVKIEYGRGEKLTVQDKIFYENKLRNNLVSQEAITKHIDFGAGDPLAYKFTEENGRAVAEIYGLGITRHAAQLYEAGYCIVLFLLMFWIWHKKRFTLPEGFSFALFMTLLWSLRFVDEFFKMNQEAFEEGLPINMGQILSIPMVLGGLVMIYVFLTKGKKTMSGEERKI